mgnify:FL=1
MPTFDIQLMWKSHQVKGYKKYVIILIFNDIIVFLVVITYSHSVSLNYFLLIQFHKTLFGFSFIYIIELGKYCANERYL